RLGVIHPYIMEIAHNIQHELNVCILRHERHNEQQRPEARLHQRQQEREQNIKNHFYSNGPSSRYDRAFSRTHKAEQKRHIEKKSPDAWYIFFIHNQGQKHPDTHDPHVQWSKPEKSSCKESP